MVQKDKQHIDTTNTFIRKYSPFPSSVPVLQLLAQLSEQNKHSNNYKKDTVFYSIPSLVFPNITQQQIYKKIKKYIKLYFFFCPACYSFNTIDIKKHIFYCSSCATMWNIFSFNYISQKISLDFIYEILQTWYAWQYSCLLVFVDNRVSTNECIIKINNISIEVSSHEIKQKKQKTKAQLQIYPDTFIWKNRTHTILHHTYAHKNNTSNIHSSTIPLKNILSIDNKNEIPIETMHIHTKDITLSIQGKKKNSILTYYFILQYLKNKYY